MKKIVFFALSVVVSLTAYSKTVSEILSTFVKPDEVSKVNMLEQAEYLEEVEKSGEENAKILKSLKRFDMYNLNTSAESLDSLANMLSVEADMTRIYNTTQDNIADSVETSNKFRQLIVDMLPVFDYVSAYALKSGDYNTDFVYIIHTAGNATPASLGMIVYVQGELTDNQLQYAIPKIEYNYDFKLVDL